MPEIEFLTLEYLVRRIEILGICLALTVPEMVPIWRSHGQLHLPVAFLGRDALQILKCLDVRALAGVADFTNADNGFTRHFVFLKKSGDIWHIIPEDGWVWTVYLLHAVQCWPEVAPEPAEHLC